MDEELRRFLDEEGVKKVHVRYCRGVDRMDFDLIRSYYHPDATDDHGEFVGGVDEFIEYGKANLPTFLSTSHFICNQLVEVRGNVAFAEHFGIAFPMQSGEFKVARFSLTGAARASARAAQLAQVQPADQRQNASDNSTL